MVFSNSEEWIADFYLPIRDWGALKSSPTPAPNKQTRDALSVKSTETREPKQPALTLEQQLEQNDRDNEAVTDAIKAKKDRP